MPSYPQAPIPGMDGLRAWEEIQNDEDRLSAAQQESFRKSLIGQHLQRVHDTCEEHRENLEASKKAWRKARESGDSEDAGIQRDQMRKHTFHYKFCQMEEICPRPTRLYGNCWHFAKKKVGHELMGDMWRNDKLKTVCKPELDVLERCLGRFVASSVDSLEQDSNPLGTTTNIHDDPEEWQ